MGALKKKERYERTGPNFSPSIFILENNSAKITISIIMGVARSESSQILYEEMVLVPPMNI